MKSPLSILLLSLVPLVSDASFAQSSEVNFVDASVQRSKQKQQRMSRRTYEEALDFARQIAWTLSEGDGSLVLAALDYGYILDEVTADLGVDGAFVGQMVQSLREEHAFGQSILDDPGNQTRYSCVGVEMGKGELIATFRYRPTTGLEYHKYHLVQTDEQVFRIRDVELVAAGESWSDRVRRLCIERLVLLNRSRMKDLPEFERLCVQNKRAFEQISDALLREEGRLALERLEELPDQLRHSRRVVALMLQAARLVPDAPFRAMHRAASDAFPHDAGIDLFAWRQAEEHGDHAMILALHTRLSQSEKLVPDGYRDAIAALAHHDDGDLKSAAILAERAVSREPDLEPAWNVLLDVTLARMDFPRVREVLRVLENRFGRETDLARDVRFHGFSTPGKSGSGSKR